MKKLIILLILFFTGIITAQVQSSISRWNSTAQELDSAGVYTGTAEVVTPYISISVTIRADSSGSYFVLFGNSSTLTNATAYKIYTMTYTAGDTAHTKTFPVVAPYFKIVYTTTATDTSNFYLATMLHRGEVVPQTINARVDVDVSSSALPSGAATAANQVIHNTKLDSLDASNTRIEGYVDGLEVKADTSNARIQEIKLDIENLKIYNAPATKYVGLTDTVTTRTDTTTFTGTWVEGEIKADDSCEVAIDGSFPSGQTYIITETTAVKLPKWAIATSDKLFVRRYGGAGTVRFYLRLNSY